MITHNLNYVKFLLNNELNALYVSIVLRTLALSMVGIFVPLYLYKELGYSLSYVIYFYIAYSLSFGIFTFPSAPLVDRFSFKYIILISSPFYILFFVSLYFLKFYSGLFFIIAILNGMVDAFFWLGFHLEFLNVSDKNKRGEEVGNWYNLSSFAGLAGPLIGGSVLIFSGFSLLFLLTGILLMGSAVPMFFCNRKNKRLVVKFKEVFSRKYLRDGIAYFGLGGTYIIAAVMWPIFMYGFLQGYLKLGSLTTVVSLITIIFTVLIAKLCDRYDRKKMAKVGAVFHGISWMMKVFIQNSFQLINFYIFRSIASIWADLPFTVLAYDRSKKRAEYLIMREMYLSLGRVAILLIVLWSGNIVQSFLWAGVFSLLQLFL